MAVTKKYLRINEIMNPKEMHLLERNNELFSDYFRAITRRLVETIPRFSRF